LGRNKKTLIQLYELNNKNERYIKIRKIRSENKIETNNIE
jgi:hypothetical protein